MENHDNAEWDMIDESFDLESDTSSRDDLEQFMTALPEKEQANIGTSF